MASDRNDFSAQLTLTSALQAITFNTYVANGAGETWFAELDGWDAAPRKPATLEDPTGDGEFPVYGAMAPRPITLSGVVKTSTLTLLKAAREKFMAACMMLPEALGSLAVADPVATQTSIYSAVEPKWRIKSCDGVTAIAEFQAGFIAPDPRKYAQSITSSSLGLGLDTPVPTATASATGGSLTTGTFGYRVSAINGSGETVASSEVQASLAPLATPGAPNLSVGASGTLSVGVYGYRVSAVNAIGQTLASAETVTGIGGSASSFSITVSWAPVAGATGYNVFGRTVGGELKMTPTPVTGTSFLDTGAVTPSGALPSSNTTATSTGSVALAWSAVAGATGYNVYGRTPSGELKMTPSPQSGTTFTDTGSVTPSGALPAGGFATTVTNAGTYRSFPTLTVAGAAAGPVVLTIGNRTLRVNTAVASGQSLVVDMIAKSVSLAGVERKDLLDNASQWPYLAPGANGVVYSGGGTATLTHRAAYA